MLYIFENIYFIKYWQILSQKCNKNFKYVNGTLGIPHLEAFDVQYINNLPSKFVVKHLTLV